MKLSLALHSLLLSFSLLAHPASAEKSSKPGLELEALNNDEDEDVMAGVVNDLKATVLPSYKTKADQEKDLVEKDNDRSLAGNLRGGEFDTKIVGGSPAAKNEFPWFVQGDGCGGSLVAKDIVLTAAHCRSAFKKRVVVGNYLYNNLDGGAQRRTIRSRLRHPGYDSTTDEFDIMLVKIDPVTNDALTPVELNFNANNPVDNEWLTVIGFGATSEGGNGSNDLLKVDVQYMSNAECDSLYRGWIFPDMMCAAVDEGGKDSCQGDSGGPIIDSDTKEQVGVVSWGDGCARRGKPGVYARVSYAQDWLKENICAMSDYDPDFCGGGGGGGGGGEGGDDAPSGSGYTYNLVFQYDDYPWETKWSLRDLQAKQNLYLYRFNSITQPGTRLEGEIDLIPGKKYLLGIRDSEDDGICCQYGNGYVQITKTDNATGQTQTLAYHNGRFGKRVNRKFTA